MKIKLILSITFLTVITLALKSQDKNTPVEITLKSGETIDALNFGKLRCGSDVYATNNYTLVRGKYKGIFTEIKDYSEIEKIVPIGYTKEPMPSVGNQKGTLKIYKKNGVVVELDDAELVPSCFSVGDKYNQITVEIMNPLTDKPVDQTVAVKDIQAIIFK